MNEVKVNFEKIIPEGKTLGHFRSNPFDSAQGKVVFAFGVLPGEEAIIDVIREKKNFIEGKAKEIIKISPDRIREKEDHFLSCSPWQIINYQKQLEYKAKILAEVFLQAAKEKIEVKKFYESEAQFGYRTKLEFGFMNKDGSLSLSFFERGNPFRKVAVPNCVLGSDKMNVAANEIIEKLNQNKIPLPLNILKNLIVRESKTKNQIISILLVNSKNFPNINWELKQSDGFILAFSNPLSPAALISEILFQTGIMSLEEKILNLEICYPFDGFFQNNLPVFEKALREIRANIAPTEKIVELYSGIGIIGLILNDKAKNIYGVEIVENLVEFAKINRDRNGIKNYEIIAKPAEKIDDDFLASTDVLVLDPPRAGLHPKLIKKILVSLPKKIIYLSCNPINQARDYNLLKENYKMEKLIGFDFYPQTPHIESLMVLKSKKTLKQI